MWSRGRRQRQADSTVTVTLKLSPARVVLLSQDVTGYKSLEKDTGGGGRWGWRGRGPILVIKLNAIKPVPEMDRRNVMIS